MEISAAPLIARGSGGKTERWRQMLKNRILLEPYNPSGDLERQLAAFVAHYNHVRQHESRARREQNKWHDNTGINRAYR
jgi:hypothetical protein